MENTLIKETPEIDLDVIDPEEIAEIVCRLCPEWSRREIRRRVLLALAGNPHYTVKSPDGET